MNVVGAPTERDQVTHFATTHFYTDTEHNYLARILKSREVGQPPVKDFTLAVGSCHPQRPMEAFIVHPVLSTYNIVSYCLTCLRVYQHTYV